MQLVGGVPQTAHVSATSELPVEFEMAATHEVEAGMARVVACSRDRRLVAAVGGDGPGVGCGGVEERLVRALSGLARRNEVLEEFAALVAHELKTPLFAALVADDPSREVGRALELVDLLLEAAREAGERPYASAAVCLEQALEDLGAVEFELTGSLAAGLPLPAASLRVILRNLLGNAVAAGARRVHVVMVHSADSSRLLVFDDGVGLAAGEGYVAGSGLGVMLCRRIAGRYGGVLELASRPAGGTRATLRLAEAS
jgi:signal transduction histidine kinase